MNNTTEFEICQEKWTLLRFTRQKIMNKKIEKDLYDYYVRHNMKKAKRLKECTSYMEFRKYKDPDETTVLTKLNMCRDRLCPNCATALSRKKFKEIVIAFDNTEEIIYLITLTVENVKGNKLRNTVDNMLMSYARFSRKMKFDKAFRSIEVTYNEQKDTYHPHIHVLATRAGKKVMKKEVKEVWTECVQTTMNTKKNYTIVDVEILQDQKGYFELCKYITKPNDMNTKTIPTFTTLKGVQLKRGNKAVTEEVKKFRQKSESEKQEQEERLKKYEYELYSYMWDGERNSYMRE